MSPIITSALTAGAFIVAFAALYFTISGISPRDFHHVSFTHPSNMNAVLSPVTATYFSVMTAATVGFGDIYPISPWAQVAVLSQVVSTAAGVTIFAAYLLQTRRDERLRIE